jgi:hypothetical protein
LEPLPLPLRSAFLSGLSGLSGLSELSGPSRRSNPQATEKDGSSFLTARI